MMDRRAREPVLVLISLLAASCAGRGAGGKKGRSLMWSLDVDLLTSRLCGRDQEINRRNPLHMIAKESLPRLQWPIRSGHHVDRNRGLGDLDAELEQLAMDLGSAPQRVLKTHSSDEVAYLLADLRSTPERTGALSVSPASTARNRAQALALPVKANLDAGWS
jgi:hypothetical protein